MVLDTPATNGDGDLKIALKGHEYPKDYGAPVDKGDIYNFISCAVHCQIAVDVLEIDRKCIVAIEATTQLFVEILGIGKCCRGDHAGKKLRTAVRDGA